MSSRKHLHFLPAVLSTGLLVACAQSSTESPDSTPCETVADCHVGQICLEGECAQQICRSDSQCGDGFLCVAGGCVRDSGDAGLDDADPDGSGVSDAGPGDSGDVAPDDGAPPDLALDPDFSLDVHDSLDGADVDFGPLRIVSSDPAPDATQVPLDATILVTFNQPMNALTFIPNNVQLLDPEGNEMPRMRGYDPETWTLSIAPPDLSTRLAPATPYTIRIDRLVRSETDENLGETWLADFSTAGYPSSAFHEDLARHYAPVLYQQVENSGTDTFAALDFDGDLDPSNNLDGAGDPNPGYVYFLVSETLTHYFVHYLLYYPGIRFASGTTNEHDMLGICVIAAKSDTLEFGTFRAVTTFYQSFNHVWAVESSWYDEPGNIDGNVADIEGRMSSAQLEGDSHPSLFIESGRHTVCLPGEGTPDGPCSPATGATAPFATGTTGLIYRAGDTAMAMGDSGNAALQYVLLPFVDKLWVLRNRTSGESAFFAGTASYLPQDERPGASLRFPSAFASDDPDNHGALPFVFQGEPVRARGMWFVDPAWFTAELVTTPESMSLDYCFNLLLGVDRRGAVPGCSAL